jgi:hypothetical protein
VTSFRTCCSHLDSNHSFGHFPFSFIFKIYFEILPCSIWKCAHTILFCYLLICFNTL